MTWQRIVLRYTKPVALTPRQLKKARCVFCWARGVRVVCELGGLCLCGRGHAFILGELDGQVNAKLGGSKN